MNLLFALVLFFGNIFSSFDFSNYLNLTSHKSFVATSAASGLAYSHSNPSQRPFGGNTFLALYPLAGHTFPTLNGGTYTCNYSLLCGGLEVEEGFFDVPSNFGYITYASPTQINVALGPISQGAGAQGLILGVRNKNVNPPVVDSYCIPFDPNGSPLVYTQFDLNTTQPFLDYTTLGGVTGGFWKGSLYGYTVDSQGNPNGSIFLKGLTDGTANPRTYNNLPTIVQAYFTGVSDLVNDRPVYRYNGVYQSQLQAYEEFYAVHKTNFLAPVGGWQAGVFEFSFYYGNFVTSYQTSVVPGKIWWSN